jgi:exodeoxyribonuclease VIII
MVVPGKIRDGGYKEILPNVIIDIPDTIYHASEGYSRTNVCDVANHSISYMQMQKNNQEQSDALLQGNMTHDLILLPEQFKQKYLVGPTVKRNTKAWKEFVIDNPGRTIVTSVMSDKSFRMRDALYDNPVIKEILHDKGCIKEASIWAIHPNTGLLIKCRPDIILDGILYDLKTTIAPHKEAFSYSCYKYGYNVQDVMYSDICRTNRIKVNGFRFLVVGSNRPHLTAIYKLNLEQIQDGYDKYTRGLNELHRYEFTDDKWTGLPYGREIVTL